MMGQDPVRGILKNAVINKVLKNDLGKGLVTVCHEQRRKMRLDRQIDSIRKACVTAEQRYPAGNRCQRGKGQHQRHIERVGHDIVSPD